MRKLLILFLLPVSLAAQIIMRPFNTYTASVPPTGLEAGLVAFWNLDEESGTRDDFIGSSNLTDVNTVTDTTGIIDNAANFNEATNEALYCLDNTTLSFGVNNSFAVAAWVDPDVTGWTTIFCKTITYDEEFTAEYGLYLENNLPRFFVCDGVDNFYVINSIYSLTFEGYSGYCFLMGWFNAATDSIYLYVDNLPVEQAYAPDGPHDGTNPFYLGRWGTYTSDGQFDGAIDLVGVWNRCPVSSNSFAMADSVYNSGSGWKPD